MNRPDKNSYRIKSAIVKIGLLSGKRSGNYVGCHAKRQTGFSPHRSLAVAVVCLAPFRTFPNEGLVDRVGYFH